MTTIGKIIVYVAFLSGAFLASLDKVTMNWVAFIPVIAGGVIGLILLKMGEKADAKDNTRLANNKIALKASLTNIAKTVTALEGRKDKVPTYDMRFEIDKHFREDLNNFAEARDSMKHLYGLMAYADIMSSFAAGERYLNRVWSASTDGYVDEVLLYISKAKDQFDHAVEEWNKYAPEDQIAL